MEDREAFFEDSRYEQCTKEMWVTVAFFVVNVVLALGLTWLFGAWRTQGAEVQLIFGLPGWYFYGGVVSSVIVVLLLILVIIYFFKDMPLEADPRDRQTREENR